MTKFLTTASAAALCALLAACGATPNFPVDGAAPPPAPTTAPGGYGSMQPIPDPAPTPAPSGTVQSQPLPPPGPVSSGSLPPLAPSAPAPRPSAGPCPPGQMQRTVTIPAPPAPPAPKPPGSGKVTNDTPAPVKVESGDTLTAISRKTGVPVKTLAELNDLKEPYRLKLGQSIKLPGKRFYTVASGDTLYAVARRFGLTAAELAEFNDLQAGKGIRAGQKLNLPEEAKDKGAPVAPKPARPKPTTRTECVVDPNWSPPSSPPPAYTPPPPAYTPPVRQPATPPPVTRPSPPPAPAPAPRPTPSPAPPVSAPAPSASSSDADIAAAGRGRFDWPARGDVIARFGPSGGGQRNDGINILAAPGAAVRAAAGGEVVYAGHQVPGFGNLVLIKHENGWVTAYAHLSNIDVKMRQQIAQGQVIGQVGQSGTVDRPQLHFEVRYAATPAERARPVDPMLVLPR